MMRGQASSEIDPRPVPFQPDLGQSAQTSTAALGFEGDRPRGDSDEACPHILGSADCAGGRDWVPVWISGIRLARRPAAGRGAAGWNVRSAREEEPLGGLRAAALLHGRFCVPPRQRRGCRPTSTVTQSAPIRAIRGQTATRTSQTRAYRRSIFAGSISVGMNSRSTRPRTSRCRSRMPDSSAMSAILCISSSLGVSIR
jgi:hypothetical protein